MGKVPVCVRIDSDTKAMVDQAAALAGFDTRGDWLAHTIDRALAGAGFLDPAEIAVRREARDGRPDRGPRSPHGGYKHTQEAAVMVAEAMAALEQEAHR